MQERETEREGEREREIERERDSGGACDCDYGHSIFMCICVCACGFLSAHVCDIAMSVSVVFVYVRQCTNVHVFGYLLILPALIYITYYCETIKLLIILVGITLL